jgi:hypothetical protein
VLVTIKQSGGNRLQQNQLSKAEMAHLRLAAGAAMLKICEQKGVGDQFTAEQFYNLSHLMVVRIQRYNFLFLLWVVCSCYAQYKHLCAIIDH